MFVARSSRVARERRNKIIQESLVALVLAGLFATTIAGLSRMKALSVTNVKVEGTKAILSDDVQTLALEELKGTEYLIFPRRNIFLYKPQALTARVRDTWKGIETVTVNFEDVHTLKIAITERTPSYLWCGDSISVSEDCYFLDASGYVFSKAPEFSGRVYFKVYGKLSDSTVVGGHYLHVADFKRIMSFVADTEKVKLAPVSLLAKEHSEYELSLKDGTKILFNGSQDLGKALHNLELVFVDPTSPIDKKKTALNLEYVDLRFSNKVFYKERAPEM